MLRIGLTGGIGSGKSTVARRLAQRGAVVVDSDVLAREVVAVGTDGLAAIVDEFGDRVLRADGGLDRPGLASVVFGDDEARARLDAIVHPRVRDRSAALVAAAPADAIVVQDVPLLVEVGMQAAFTLVVVVHADGEERVRRLVRHRGMGEADARSRVAAQADDGARRAAADVWLDNCGAVHVLVAAVDALWDGRLVPFEENIRLRRVAAGDARRVPADPTWTAQGNRLCARIAVAAGGRARSVVHVGPTAVPGLPAADVLGLRVGVDLPADAAALRAVLPPAGFPVGGAGFGAADPARPLDIRVCRLESPEWRSALVVREWLRADAGARAEYVGLPERDDPDATARWWDEARPRAEAWAATSGWCASLTPDGVAPGDGDG